jgi:hypothetical protein
MIALSARLKPRPHTKLSAQNLIFFATVVILRRVLCAEGPMHLLADEILRNKRSG